MMRSPSSIILKSAMASPTLRRRRFCNLLIFLHFVNSYDMMLLKEKGVAAIVMKNWTCFSYKWYINASERQIKNARIMI